VLCQGNNVSQLAKIAELIEREMSVDFVDLNMGCPIDLVFQRGMGSALMDRFSRVKVRWRGGPRGCSRARRCGEGVV
jgi:tRNA-dihydrouridine synthase 3